MTTDTINHTIIITSVLPTLTAFAVCADTGEQVFIPSSVSKACNLQNGMIVKAMLVPNNHNSDDVPWMAPVIVTTDKDQPIADPKAVNSALAQFEYPVRAEEIDFNEIDLQNAHQVGLAVKVIVKEKPDAKAFVMWAASLDQV